MGETTHYVQYVGFTVQEFIVCRGDRWSVLALRFHRLLFASSRPVRRVALFHWCRSLPAPFSGAQIVSHPLTRPSLSSFPPLPQALQGPCVSAMSDLPRIGAGSCEVLPESWADSKGVLAGDELARAPGGFFLFPPFFSSFSPLDVGCDQALKLDCGEVWGSTREPSFFREKGVTRKVQPSSVCMIYFIAGLGRAVAVWQAD